MGQSDLLEIWRIHGLVRRRDAWQHGLATAAMTESLRHRDKNWTLLGPWSATSTTENWRDGGDVILGYRGGDPISRKRAKAFSEFERHARLQA